MRNCWYLVCLCLVGLLVLVALLFALFCYLRFFGFKVFRLLGFVVLFA